MVQRVQGMKQWRKPNQNGEFLHRITRTVIARPTRLISLRDRPEASDSLTPWLDLGNLNYAEVWTGLQVSGALTQAIGLTLTFRPISREPTRISPIDYALGDDRYLIRTEDMAAGVPVAEAQVQWSVDQWLKRSQPAMDDPILGLLQGDRPPLLARVPTSINWVMSCTRPSSTRTLSAKAGPEPRASPKTAAKSCAYASGLKTVGYSDCPGRCCRAMASPSPPVLTLPLPATRLI